MQALVPHSHIASSVALCAAEVLKRQRDAAAQKKAKAERRKAKAEAEVGGAVGFGRRRLNGHIKLSLHRRVGPPPLNWRPNHAMPHPNCLAQSQLGRDVTGERPPVCPHPQAAAASAPAKPKAAPSGPIAFLFPGQGSQAVGMLKVGWAEWRGLLMSGTAAVRWCCNVQPKHAANQGAVARMVLPPAQHHRLPHLPTLTIDRRSLPTCLL